MAAGGEGSKDKSRVKDDTGFYHAYSGFARNLRAWFIAYGIGAPVLFLTNDSAWKALRASGDASQVCYLFLAGVTLQVISAMIFKGAMWYLYMGEMERAFRDKKRYKASEWLSEAFWLELAIDLGTAVFFGVATLKTIWLLTA